MKRYYNKKELAQELGVTIQAIDNWRKDGLLPYIKMGNSTNSRVIFDMQDVELYLERRKYNTQMRGYNQGLKRTSGFRAADEDLDTEYDDSPPIDDDYTNRPPDIY